MGILSKGLMGVLQESQWDAGLIKLIFPGTRCITTFKKLPKEAPRIIRKKKAMGSGIVVMLFQPLPLFP
jgi:hypothetical protein